MLASCKKNTTQLRELSAHDKELIAMYSKVGGIHNQGLDALYAKLVERKNGKSKIASYATRSLQVKPTDDNVGSEQVPLGDINELSFAYIQDISQIQGITSFVPFYSADLLLADPGVSYSTSILDHCYQANGILPSTELQYALSQLEYVFKNDNTTQLYYLYDNLITTLVPTLTTDNDKISFIGTASVAKNSIQYWSTPENMSMWNTLLGQLNGSSNSVTSYNMKDVAWADVSGAAAGAVRGAWVGLAGGTVAIPGLGTAVGGASGVLVGMIGGAIGSSAAEGIHSAIKWLINW
jgi:hypothetical protein